MISCLRKIHLTQLQLPTVLQHEMALVNDDYGNGEGDISEYLEQIGALTDNQLLLLSSLKEVSS